MCTRLPVVGFFVLSIGLVACGGSRQEKNQQENHVQRPVEPVGKYHFHEITREYWLAKQLPDSLKMKVSASFYRKKVFNDKGLRRFPLLFPYTLTYNRKLDIATLHEETERFSIVHFPAVTWQFTDIDLMAMDSLYFITRCYTDGLMDVTKQDIKYVVLDFKTHQQTVFTNQNQLYTFLKTHRYSGDSLMTFDDFKEWYLYATRGGRKGYHDARFPAY